MTTFVIRTLIFMTFSTCLAFADNVSAEKKDDTQKIVAAKPDFKKMPKRSNLG